MPKASSKAPEVEAPVVEAPAPEQAQTEVEAPVVEAPAPVSVAQKHSLPASFDYNKDVISADKAVELLDNNKFKNYTTAARAIRTWGYNRPVGAGADVFINLFITGIFGSRVTVILKTQADLMKLKIAAEENFKRNGYDINFMLEEANKSSSLNLTKGGEILGA